MQQLYTFTTNDPRGTQGLTETSYKNVSSHVATLMHVVERT